MDWNAIQQYLPLYQKAAVLTVRLGVAGIIFAIIIGLACAVIQHAAAGAAVLYLLWPA